MGRPDVQRSQCFASEKDSKVRKVNTVVSQNKHIDSISWEETTILPKMSILMIVVDRVVWKLILIILRNFFDFAWQKIIVCQKKK